MEKDPISYIEDFIYAEHKPVSFREFVTSPDFCNNKDLYEYWFEQEKETKSSVSEIIITGSLGSGKSTYASYYFAYRIYCLFLQGSPQETLHLAANSDIYVLYFSISMTMAKKSGYNLLYTIFDTCKWFNDNYPINKDLRSSIEFPNHFHIDYASSETHQTGLNIWGFILDEANFRAGVGEGMVQEYAEVTLLYTQLIDRLISRFARPDGTIEALAMLISSSSYQSSFTEQRINSVKDDPNTKVIVAVTYEIKPWQFSKEKFEVFIGAGVLEPSIVENDIQKKEIVKALNMEGLPLVEQYFRQVPVNLKKAFLTNLPLALQNHCGVSTSIKGRFISDMRVITRMYDDIPQFFASNQITLSNKDTTQLIDYVQFDNIEYPDKPHSFYLDLSVRGDSGGFSCFRYDGSDGEFKYHTHVFTLEIIPPPYPAMTQINKIRKFVQDISNYLNVVAFSSDAYQSTQLRQEVTEDLGLTDIRLSIDSSDIFHLHFIRACVEQRLRLIQIEKLETEWREAEHNLKLHKVQRSSNSTDDLMQSQVGAFYVSDVLMDENVQLDETVNVVGARSVESYIRKINRYLDRTK